MRADIALDASEMAPYLDGRGHVVLAAAVKDYLCLQIGVLKNEVFTVVFPDAQMSNDKKLVRLCY